MSERHQKGQLDINRIYNPIITLATLAFVREFPFLFPLVSLILHVFCPQPFAMVNSAFLAAAAAGAFFASPASAAMYLKSSPVIQVDAKNYESLIAKSNHTSVSHNEQNAVRGTNVERRSSSKPQPHCLGIGIRRAKRTHFNIDIDSMLPGVVTART
jgi:hypothetical protein